MTLTDDQLFATCVCDEAANQPHEGKVAVAIVILNRMAAHYASDGTVAGTILAPNQFSGFWFEMVDGKYTRICSTTAQAQAQAMKLFLEFDSSRAWDDAVQAIADARAWEAGQPMSFTPGPAFAGLTRSTVLYYNPAITRPSPAWAIPAKQAAVIFDHTFFNR